MTVRVCAKAVSLDQRYYAATRAAYDPAAEDVTKFAAQVTRVALRKLMIRHIKECGLC